MSDVDLHHTSDLRDRLEFDIRIWGKNLDEDKTKTSGYTAIALLKSLSGA
jgi:hypothetical protein